MTVTDDAQSRTEQDDTERGTVSEGGRAKKSVSGFGSWGDVWRAPTISGWNSCSVCGLRRSARAVNSPSSLVVGGGGSDHLVSYLVCEMKCG